nr:alpha-tocopherol transfer protein-like [Onthophagus taurus]
MRCVKCAGEHWTNKCTKAKEIPAKCFNCGENHPANYRGCIVIKELQAIRHKKTVNSNKIKPGASYAEKASGETTEKTVSTLTDKKAIVRFLRARKFDSKKAFQMIQRYYLMKLKCPELFRCPLPSECENVFDLQAQFMLPNRDQLGRRIYIIRVDNFDASKASIDEIFRANVLALEQVVKEEQTQICGIVVVLDMAGLSLNHAKFFTPYYAKKTVELVQETFPLRFKGFHIVNEPFYFDAVMAVIKPFLKEKMKKRVIIKI